MARFFQPKKKTNIETKHQSVLVEKLDNLGSGIAYLNKKPVFVEQALPGEKVVVQLTESKSKFSRAKLIKVLEPSDQRVDPFCDYYQQCGGCNLQHLELDSQREYKQLSLSQLMSKFAGQELMLEPMIKAEDKGYRRRARISLFVDKKTRQLQFGFRKKQSKQIVNIDHCDVLEPSLSALLPELKSLLSSFKNPESLGHIELVKANNGIILVLRHLKPLAEKDRNALVTLAEQHLATLYLMPSNDKLERIRGEVAEYQEAGVTLSFMPNHFIQVNQDVNQKMITQALDWLGISGQDRVLDLFCGLGNFSLPMAKRANSVVGVEGVDEMVVQASQNAQSNDLDNARFYQANLEEDLVTQPWAKEKFDKVLLDPARAGASGIVDQISQFGAKSVVYVSCNPATLARDSQSLLEQGYQLKKLGMLDMFPHSSHLESMALFEK
ncbi:23S rRNA (uracil(1939)-C(5))-methyltransferase RlmD [Vibrio sp. 10N.261.55.A7]|uniref:23S rRNA (uracil(1939)-C(5))-methyltransferase RlmD n=1 Tax=Vibrio sp. 10N.261.55.A7 TaxID=1880851 RepID=UPI000C814F24|nr:23S rRNA (uracil(1939)-C(5))-methyltransferase RlmD [Vibrio sp. 10N.261.55.A7]PMJ90062.1 23S rRNA (uracil(1939)-C(5))-methyltransferase [Vibrio sp. 10N.261.55.A7]